MVEIVASRMGGFAGRTLLVTGALLAVVAVGGDALAQRTSLPVRQGPPAAKFEPVPPTPITDSVWVPGHWRRLAGTWIWSSGRYLRRPTPNSYYVAGAWRQSRFGWTWTDGQWRDPTAG